MGLPCRRWAGHDWSQSRLGISVVTAGFWCFDIQALLALTGLPLPMLANSWSTLFKCKWTHSGPHPNQLLYQLRATIHLSRSQTTRESPTESPLRLFKPAKAKPTHPLLTHSFPETTIKAMFSPHCLCLLTGAGTSPCGPPRLGTSLLSGSVRNHLSNDSFSSSVGLTTPEW